MDTDSNDINIEKLEAKACNNMKLNKIDKEGHWVWR